MHRISERAFEAKADLERCERMVEWVKGQQKLWEGVDLPRTKAALGEELRYWEMRAESARGMMKGEGVVS